jgi:hypothetical protein
MQVIPRPLRCTFSFSTAPCLQMHDLTHLAVPGGGPFCF